jgi:hypothetical protein
LFLGNYERMRAVNKDGTPNSTVRGDEQSRLAVAWRQRHNPILRYTDDGVSTDMMVGGQVNPFGYLEFVRETQKQMTDNFDKEYLAALDMVEV